MARERLPRQRISDDVEEGRSIRVTEAPLSAKMRPAKGPGARPANWKKLIKDGKPVGQSIALPQQLASQTEPFTAFCMYRSLPKAEYTTVQVEPCLAS